MICLEYSLRLNIFCDLNENDFETMHLYVMQMLVGQWSEVKKIKGLMETTIR